MKSILAALFLLCAYTQSNGQAYGIIYINKEMMPVAPGMRDHIEFEAGKSSLNDEGEAYMKYFLDTYGKLVRSSDGIIMHIVPASNSTDADKNNLNNKVGLKRVDAIAKYVYKYSDIVLGKAVMDGKNIVFGMRGRKK